MRLQADLKTRYGGFVAPQITSISEEQAAMKIGIIGSGNMGGCLGKLWSRAGHDVMFSFTRDPRALEAAAAAAGGRSGAVVDAAQFGDVVLVAVPWAAIDVALNDVAAALAGKIVISCNNPLKPDL